MVSFCDYSSIQRLLEGLINATLSVNTMYSHCSRRKLSVNEPTIWQIWNVLRRRSNLPRRETSFRHHFVHIMSHSEGYDSEVTRFITQLLSNITLCDQKLGNKCNIHRQYEKEDDVVLNRHQQDSKMNAHAQAQTHEALLRECAPRVGFLVSICACCHVYKRNTRVSVENGQKSSIIWW